MDNGPTELRQDNWIQRRLESASIAGIISGMMLILAIICVLFGTIVGRFTTTINDYDDNQLSIHRDVTEQLATNAILFHRLHSWAEENDIPELVEILDDHVKEKEDGE